MPPAALLKFSRYLSDDLDTVALETGVAGAETVAETSFAASLLHATKSVNTHKTATNIFFIDFLLCTTFKLLLNC